LNVEIRHLVRFAFPKVTFAFIAVLGKKLFYYWCLKFFFSFIAFLHVFYLKGIPWSQSGRSSSG